MGSFGKTAKAFTLIEMTVVIALTVIICGIGIVDMTEMIKDFDQINAQNQLITDMRRAQNLAMTQGCRGVFTVDNDGGGYGFDCDYLDYDITEPEVGDGICTATVCPGFRANLPPHVSLSVTNQPVIFNSRGLVIDINGNYGSRTFSMNYTRNGVANTFKTGTVLTTGALNFN